MTVELSELAGTGRRAPAAPSSPRILSPPLREPGLSLRARQGRWGARSSCVNRTSRARVSGSRAAAAGVATT